MSECKCNEIIVRPVECLENGCTAKSEKCNCCAYCYYPWFVWASSVAKNGELCYNKKSPSKK